MAAADRPYQIALTACVLAPVLIGTLIMVLYGPILVDDGYYYLEVALHASRGVGFSFDGIHTTNGFQPLWQVLLIPLMGVLGACRASLILVIFLQLLLFASAGALLYRAARELEMPGWISISPAMLWLLNLWLITKGGMSGMETGLLILTHGLFILALIRRLSRGSGNRLVIVASTLMVASRLDSITLVLACGVAVALITGRVRDSLRMFAPSACFLVLYMALNWMLAGHPLPVSGYVKSGTGRMLLIRLFTNGDTALFRHGFRNLLEFLTLGGRLSPAAVLALVVVCVGLVLAALRRAGRTIRILVVGHLIYTGVLLLLYSHMYSSLLDTYTYYWFQTIYGWLLLIPVLLFGGLGSSRLSTGLAFALVGLTIVFGLLYGADLFGTYAFQVPFDERPEMEGVAFLNDLEEGTIVASWDAGLVGFFCHHPVINLDGLVNSYEYLEILEAEGLEGYLRWAGVTHVSNIDFLREKREMIEQSGSWELLFESSVRVERQISRFSLAPETRSYSASGMRTFYVYGRLVPAD